MDSLFAAEDAEIEREEREERERRKEEILGRAATCSGRVSHATDGG